MVCMDTEPVDTREVCVPVVREDSQCNNANGLFVRATPISREATLSTSTVSKLELLQRFPSLLIGKITKHYLRR